MEFVPGGSLSSSVTRFGGSLPEPLVSRYTRHILTGLAHLHRLGIAHRDVKAANCLLTGDGGVKLADFGAAKRTLPAGAASVAHSGAADSLVTGSTGHTAARPARRHPLSRGESSDAFGEGGGSSGGGSSGGGSAGADLRGDEFTGGMGGPLVESPGSSASAAAGRVEVEAGMAGDRAIQSTVDEEEEEEEEGSDGDSGVSPSSSGAADAMPPHSAATAESASTRSRAAPSRVSQGVRSRIDSTDSVVTDVAARRRHLTRRGSNDSALARGGGSVVSRDGASFIGTPMWMAPEVMRQETDAEKDGWLKADVWSVGCTVLELLTGRPPWNKFSNPLALVYHIASGECPRPRAPAGAHARALVVLASLALALSRSRNPQRAALPPSPSQRR